MNVSDATCNLIFSPAPGDRNSGVEGHWLVSAGWAKSNSHRFRFAPEKDTNHWIPKCTYIYIYIRSLNHIWISRLPQIPHRRCGGQPSWFEGVPFLSCLSQCRLAREKKRMSSIPWTDICNLGKAGLENDAGLFREICVKSYFAKA